ncbi:MAG: PaaI family thioesterase [Proteobacteria bacterium]|nr:PaaI family thioesterase [Pseudomonadota bacterium]
MPPLADRIRASFEAQALMHTLGASLERVEPGEVHIALPHSARIAQQQGFVHAGALTSIADSACGYAALTRMPPGSEVVSAEFKINLLRPAIGQRFLAIGKVVSSGRTLTVCTGEVHAHAADGTHKLVALMQATMVRVEAVG